MYNWRKVLLKPTDAIATVIQCLEREGTQIVLIVDGQGKLIGTITDGDIRRALVRRLGMDTLAGEIMFTRPITASVGDGREAILEEMKNAKVIQIPLLDSDGCVVGLETLQSLLEIKKLNTPVCLMARGFGQRVLPLISFRPPSFLNIFYCQFISVLFQLTLK